MSYTSDLDIDYDKDGEIEVEVDSYDPERRQRLLDRGQEVLQDLDSSHIRDLFGR